MLSLQRMSWAIVEELHGNIADGDKLKAYIKSPRYWKPQHFSSLIAFYIIRIPAPLAGNQQPWELNKAGSELTPQLSFPLPSRRYFLSGRWVVKHYQDKFKEVWELAKRVISCMLLRVSFILLNPLFILMWICLSAHCEH